MLHDAFKVGPLVCSCGVWRHAHYISTGWPNPRSCFGQEWFRHRGHRDTEDTEEFRDFASTTLPTTDGRICCLAITAGAPRSARGLFVYTLSVQFDPIESAVLTGGVQYRGVGAAYPGQRGPRQFGTVVFFAQVHRHHMAPAGVQAGIENVRRRFVAEV